MNPKRALDAALIAAAIALLTLLGLARSAQQHAQTSYPSTFDTGPHGYAALYSFLQSEKVRVEQFEAPLAAIFSFHGTFVVAGDEGLAAFLPSDPRQHPAGAWVSGGGTLLLLGTPTDRERRNLDLKVKSASPLRYRGASFGYAYRRGRGAVIWVTRASVFDNAHLASARNAVFAYALFQRRRVAFDERVYGHAAGPSFWGVLPFDMRAAIAVSAALLLLTIVGANLPFAPARAPQALPPRDTGAYIAALAALLERARTQRASIARILAAVGPAFRHSGCRDQAEYTALQTLAAPGDRDLIAAARLAVRITKEHPC